jgi:hypothetical protein
MSHMLPSDVRTQSQAASPREAPDSFEVEVWKHFASTGGADKNTMITIVSALLTIVSTAIGYMLSSTANPGTYSPSRSWARWYH